MNTTEHEPIRFRARWWEYLIVLCIGLLEAGALVAFTLLMRLVTQELVSSQVGKAAQELYRAALINVGWMILLSVVLGALRFLEFGFTERVGYQAVRKLRMAMYQHLQGMTPDQVRHRARGGLLLRLTGDLSMLRMYLSRGQLLGMVSIITLSAGVGVIAYLNAWMGVAVVLAAALTGVVSLSSGRVMRSSTRTMRRRRSTLIGNIDEQINSLAVVQTGGRMRGEYERLSRQNDTLTRALNRVAWLRAVLRGLAYMGSLITTVLVLGVGLEELRSGRTTISAVVAALITVRFLSRPIRVLGLAHDYWHRGQVSRQKVAEFMASSSRGFDQPELERLRVRKGRIEFDHVTVGPLYDVSLTAEPGHLIAITGPTGAGKSTLLRTISRLADVESGQVRIDDQDIATLNPLSVSRRVGYASADLPLLRGTVRRNLSYCDREATDADIQRIVFMLGLEEVLADVPGGLNGWLTEGGSNLSVGQRQLVMLGRAMVANPPILLLDEPMVGLDRASQARVRRLIQHYQGTIFIVTHSIADLSMADVVWTIRPGEPIDVRPGDDYTMQAFQQEGFVR